MSTQTLQPNLTKGQLAQVVRTGGAREGVGKMRALAMLRSRKRRDAGDILMEVVADQNQELRFRTMAAMGLYELGGSKADAALAEAAQHADPSLAGTLALGLGRVGSADRMGLLEELAGATVPHLKQRAGFAATLLAYRHGLNGHEAGFPTKRQLQDLGRRKSKPIKIGKATPTQAKTAATALKEQPLEVALSMKNALSIQCGPNSFVWLWTAKMAEAGIEAAAERKGVAALMFRKNRFEDRYALSAVVLATPSRAGLRLTVHRADSGGLLYAGVVGKNGALQLKARIQPGLAAVDIKAKLIGADIEVTSAKSAVIARDARAPKSG